MAPPGSEPSGLGLVAAMRARVEATNACALPGCAIKYDNFMHAMWRAVAHGHVEHAAASFVAGGLRHGFTAGVDVVRLARMGNRWFSNYKSAEAARIPVRQAIMKRVARGKTLSLGAWTSQLAGEVRAYFANSFIFPMGAVEKALERGVFRPTSDHSRTGLNAASDLSFLRHSLNTYNEIAEWFRTDYFMRVSDVEDAFPMLPLHPDVWPYFLHRFYVDDHSDAEGLFLNIMGDFGASGMPGTFKVFFCDVVMGMARDAHVLTLPMPVYVDDCTLIGPDRELVDAEMVAFHTWAAEVCGVTFKALKDRVAATRQLALGFWWDSKTLTRELDERKLLLYLDFLADFATRPKLTLREMQQMGGRLQRCLMTLPPGAACLGSSLFSLMAGLKLPWHERRTTRQMREDLKCVHRLLTMNMGKGFYSYANFKPAPPVQTDASKQARYVGGGWCSACGAYDWWRYGASAARKCIDFLEGDTIVEAVRALAPKWRGCIVEFYCDNQAFQRSGAKGRSRAQRLNDLLRELFVLMIEFGFVISWLWISTHDNVNADHLSRGREADFLRTVYETGFWAVDTVVRRLPDAGRVRRLPEKRGEIPRTVGAQPAVPPDLGPAVPAKRTVGNPRDLAGEGAGHQGSRVPSLEKLHGYDSAHGGGQSEMRAAQPAVSPGLEAYAPTTATAAAEPPAGDTTGNYFQRAMAGVGAAPRAPRAAVGVRRGGSVMLALALIGCFCVGDGAAVRLTQQQASLSYARTSIFTGMPDGLRTTVESIMDSRLSESSWRTVRAGHKRWLVTCAARGFTRVIETDDPERGQKLAAFVVDMLTDTSYVWSTISQYVWGVRVWQQSQGHADPIMGVLGWDTFMQGVRVLSWVPHEPRKRVPYEVISRILDYILSQEPEFMLLQMGLLILVLLFTFSRTECPCPKTVNGRQNYDKEKHFRVEDFEVAPVKDTTTRALWVRFRAIKQDPRVERPEARADRGDGVVGDWSCLGEVDVDKWNPIWWYRAVVRRWSGRRARDAPMFLDEAMQNPLTYGKALRWFYGLQRVVGVADKDLAGLHGLRVEGYNRTKAALGQPLAQAHGLWASAAVNRYERFMMTQVVRVTGAIAGVDDGDAADTPNESAERPVAAVRATRDGLRAAASAPAAEAAPEAAGPSSPLASESDDAGSGYAESEEEDDGEEDEVFFGRVIGRRPEGASHWLTPPLRAPNALQASPARFSAPDGGRHSPTGRRSRQGSPSVAQSTSGQQ